MLASAYVSEGETYPLHCGSRSIAVDTSADVSLMRICETHFVRDDRFRHLCQVPSQDGSDIVRRVLGVLPIQIFAILRGNHQ